MYRLGQLDAAQDAALLTGRRHAPDATEMGGIRSEYAGRRSNTNTPSQDEASVQDEMSVQGEVFVQSDDNTARRLSLVEVRILDSARVEVLIDSTVAALRTKL